VVLLACSICLSSSSSRSDLESFPSVALLLLLEALPVLTVKSLKTLELVGCLTGVDSLVTRGEASPREVCGLLDDEGRPLLGEAVALRGLREKVSDLRRTKGGCRENVNGRVGIRVYLFV
jgi:hypothetical protein